MNIDCVFFDQGKKSSSLILFFNGWGCDSKMFSHIAKSSCHDVMIVSDYRDLEITHEVLEAINAYKTIHVAAWSFGVWVANYICKRYGIVPCSGVAYNGTLYPIDDSKGIPENIAYATLEYLSPQNVAKFRLRMVGGRTGLELLSITDNFRREYVDVRDELDALYGYFDTIDSAPEEGGYCLYKHAVVGTRDAIMPFDAQKKAWSEAVVTVSEIDAPHFCFARLQTWDDIVV